MRVQLSLPLWAVLVAVTSMCVAAETSTYRWKEPGQCCSPAQGKHAWGCDSLLPYSASGAGSGSLSDAGSPGLGAESLGGAGQAGAASDSDSAISSFFESLNPQALASGSRGQFASFGPNSIGDMLAMPSYIWAFDGLAVSSEIPTGQLIKAVENNSPLPQNRIFFNYNHYHHAFQSDSNFNFFSGSYDKPLDNYTFGIEKTFFDGLCSLDVRIPFHGRVAYPFGNFYLGQTSNMGDVYLAPKVLIHSWDQGALSAGVGISLPTGSNIEGYVNITAFEIDRESLHLAPFLGYVSSPVDRLYVMLWGQLDFDTSGDRYTTTPILAPMFAETSVVQQPAAGYVSGSFAWYFLEGRTDRWLQDLAGILELHYSGTIGSEDAATGVGSLSILRYGSFDIDGNPFNGFGGHSILNMTAGMHFELAGGLNCRVAGVVPLTGGRNRMFPFELVVQSEWRF